MTVVTRETASGTPDSFPFVEAKLQPLTSRPGTIERARLVRLLTDPSGPPITSLIAPPGYGKTTLLAQWAARERRPVAWLTLDDLDNDPVFLVTYLAAAFGRIRPVDASVLSGLSGSRQRIFAASVPRLASELHRWGKPAVLVLDDAHRLVDPVCLDALAALLDHLPARFRVAIAGRTEPDLPFGRFRAQRTLLEIGPGLLALDEDEAAALTAAAGYQLSPDEIRDLTVRTEGWAAGIYLAILARGRGEQGSHPIGSVSGGDRYIASYLRSEFVAGLDAEDVSFLTRTSVLETILPSVAEAVAGLPGAAERLHRLAHANLLIHELGGSVPAYRYHNLLREFLSSELERREPDLVPELHRRAAAWYAAAGRIERAVEHAMASRDKDCAADYVTAAVLPMHYRGQSATTYRWLRAFEREEFERHPPLAVVAAWVYLMTGRPGDADRVAEIAERATFERQPADGSASFESQRAMLRAVMAPNGPKELLANARLAVSQEGPGSPWQAVANMLLGGAYFVNGDLDAADASYQDAVTAAGSAAPATLMVSLAKRASIRIRWGDWEAAEAFIEQSRTQLVDGRYEDIISSLLVHALDARIAIHRGDLDRGREALVRAQLVRPLANHAAPWFCVDGLLELARAYLAVSDPGGAQAVLREAEQIVRHRPALGTLTTELIELRRRLAGATATLAGSSTLTTAELRVLPLLPTYLSFQEIAERLMISRNTVKTHAMSIYGKLWASSRGEAVERAVELGLLEPYPVLGLTRATVTITADPGDESLDEES